MASWGSDFESNTESGIMCSTSEDKQSSRNCNLRGIVDMGSNGIHFSVTDLSRPRSRNLPTVHDYRVDISLYEAQFDRETGQQILIPQNIIEEVIAALNRFKVVCADLGLSDTNIHVLATEATRTAINSAEFLSAINSGTGLPVDILGKEEEGRIGALGVASGFSDIKGLMMDLGGGSTQITWIISEGGNVRISDRGSINLPYGAAALPRTMEALQRGKSKEEADKALAALRREMLTNFQDAYAKLRVPEGLVTNAKAEGGFPLYLSGGGCRDWGYLLLHMSQMSEHPHPISIVNGYKVGRERFADTKAMEEVARTAHSLFRVSDRRRKQVPAVAFLINVLHQAIPHGIRSAHFCQGGVREGLLFRDLEPGIRAEDPLEVATRMVAPASARTICSLLMYSFPEPSQTGARKFPDAISAHVIQAFANLLYLHAIMDNEVASMSALYSTSTGLLSSTRGVSHEDRARLALMLESRYMGELPPREVRFRESLRQVITPEEVWWAGYLGRIGYFIGRFYPSGRIGGSKPRISLSSEWAWDLGRKRRREGLRLVILVQKTKHDPARLKQALRDHVGIIEKVGKKKNWVGGPDGWGMKVEVKVVQEDLF